MKRITLALVVVAALSMAAGCATWKQQCTGDPESLPCPCPGQRNPGCYEPLNDDPLPLSTKPAPARDAGADR